MDSKQTSGIFAWLWFSGWWGLILLSPAWGQSEGDANDPQPLTSASGRHIKLASDVHSLPETIELVDSFDRAVQQWQAFWGLSDADLERWKIEAFVMRDQNEFRRRNWIPPRVPPFRHGYALERSVWVVAQPSQYYTRHLLLHEGMHALAFEFFGGAGPAWYMEGTAEMMSTHRGVGRDLLINQLPRRREEVPYWGRFKAIAERREAGSIPSLDAVMDFPNDLNNDAEAYAWCWMAAMILYAYPEYRDVFFAAAKNGRDTTPAFNRLIRSRLASQWPVLRARWRLMCRDLDYGFDWQRERVQLSTRDPLWQGDALDIRISSDQGWQSAGVRFPPGTRLSVTAAGSVILAETSRPWTSHPDGVTIRYEQGRPLGQLLACVVPNAPGNAATELVLPTIAIGAAGDIVIREHSWVVFRVNDAIGELADNQGVYQVNLMQRRASVPRR